MRNYDALWGGNRTKLLGTTQWGGFHVTATDVNDATIYGYTTTVSPVSNAWHYVGVAYDGTVARIHVDGAIEVDTDVLADRTLSRQDLRLGYGLTAYGDSTVWDGMLDEFRISSVARSPGWMQTEWLNQSNPRAYVVAGEEQDIEDDPDEDGMSTMEEAIGGTDPEDEESVFRVSGIRCQGEEWRVMLESVSGRLYAVEWKEDLLGTNGWEDLTNNWPGTGGLMEFGDGVGATQRFYRVRVRMEE